MALTLYVKNNIKIKYFLIFLIFLINTNYCFAKGKQYHTLQVEISGINQELTEAIKKDLLIFQATSDPKLTKLRIENLYDKANLEIINNLQSLGYYHATIKTSSLQEISNNHWLVNYNIELGIPTKIKQIDLQITGEASNNPKLLQKIHNLSIKFLHVNQQLNHGEYEKTKQYILNKLHDYGFLNTQFNTSIVKINTNNYTASIIFIIDSKQQYYFGPITFESDQYPPSFLQQYIPFKEHDLYLAKNLMQLKDNLLNSGLFAKVRIDTSTLSTDSNNIIPITARVYAKPANNYNASVGYGTDTGIRGNAGYTRKRFSHPGHQININLTGSKIRKNAIIDYSLLGADPTIDKYNFGVTAAEEHIQQRYDKNASLYIQKSKKYDNRQQFWKLNLLTETFKELPAKEKQHANFLLPSLRLVWVHHKNNTANNDDDNDNNENQTNFGNKLDINTKLASKILGSANLLQFNINEKWIKPLIYDLRLICKGTIGITSIKDIEKLPLSLRFFAGGDYSVRGFAYESLGPMSTDSAGNTKVVGGKHLVLGSLEIEKTIYHQISAAYFIDVGNALNTFNQFNLKKLAIGTGVGLIYKTPIGSVRAYIAKPLQLPQQMGNLLKKHIRFHLTFDAGL